MDKLDELAESMERKSTPRVGVLGTALAALAADAGPDDVDAVNVARELLRDIIVVVVPPTGLECWWRIGEAEAGADAGPLLVLLL